MFTSPLSRKWILILALPLVSITSIANADDSERLRILDAIEQVNVKIDLTTARITVVKTEVSEIKVEIEKYTKLYEESRKDDDLRAIEQAKAKLYGKTQLLLILNAQLREYHITLEHLEAKLAELGG